jgi:hypothetical protein
MALLRYDVWCIRGADLRMIAFGIRSRRVVCLTPRPLNCWEKSLVYPLDSRLDRPQSVDGVEQGNPLAPARIEPLFVGVPALTWSPY